MRVLKRLRDEKNDKCEAVDPELAMGQRWPLWSSSPDSPDQDEAASTREWLSLQRRITAGVKVLFVANNLGCDNLNDHKIDRSLSPCLGRKILELLIDSDTIAKIDLTSKFPIEIIHRKITLIWLKFSK